MFHVCESAIKENLTILLKGYLESLLEVFVNHLLDTIDTIRDFSDLLIDWLFDSISLNKATVTLTIWVVRE
jgi:hypothetical protein